MSPKKKRQVSKGTGKRYESTKPRPQSLPVQRITRPPSSAETSLRRRISQFGLSERFREDFEKAFELYMGPGSVQQRGEKKEIIVDSEAEFQGFQEWFYFDYVLRSNDRIIDLFIKEVGPDLSFVQRNILAEWQPTNRLRLMETQSTEPGIGETMQDLLSGEILQINDISFSYSAPRWSIVLARPLLTEGNWSFTGSGILLEPSEKLRILNVAKELWDAYQRNNPQAELLDFYRDHSLDLLNAAREIKDERSNPKVILSAEGHPALNARAEFIIHGDSHDVEAILGKAEEFVLANVVKKGEYAGCLHYNWLLRGRSHIPQVPTSQLPPKGLKLISKWTEGPGKPDYTSLGDLNLCEERLHLECSSRERLEAGKKLLQEVLGRRIEHVQDQFRDLSESREEDDFDDEDGDEIFENPEEQQIVDTEMREHLTRNWLDTPDLKGVTPRQLAQTPKGREELRDLMKTLEYIEDRALKSGEKPPMRLDIIRKELGL